MSSWLMVWLAEQVIVALIARSVTGMVGAHVPSAAFGSVIVTL